MRKLTFYHWLKAGLIVLGAVVAVVVMQLSHDRVAAEQTEGGNPYKDMVFNGLSIDSVVEKYHSNVNDYFNGKVKQLMVIAKSGTDEDIITLTARVTPPEQTFDSAGLANGRKDCKTAEEGGENLSTYCAANDLTKQYLMLREALMIRRQEALSEVRQRFETIGAVRQNAFEQQRMFGGTPLGEGQKNIQDYGQIANQVDEELDLARKSLDQGLAAYNEMQISLPMHIKYKKLTKALELYRDKLSSLRKEIELYPGTFIDVTTPACT